MRTPDTPWSPARVELRSGVALYVVPAVAVVLDRRYDGEARVPVLGDVPIVGMNVAFLLLILSIGFGATLVYRSLLREDKHHREPDEETDAKGYAYTEDRSALLTEYEQVGQEARYRDRLIIRTNYFTLVIFAALVSVYVTAPVVARPAITLIGSVIAFVFATAVKKYAGARNALREYQHELESSQVTNPPLSISGTLKGREREGLDELHMSSLIYGLHVLLAVFLVCWYAVTVGLVVYDVTPIVPP